MLARMLRCQRELNRWFFGKLVWRTAENSLPGSHRSKLPRCCLQNENIVPTESQWKEGFLTKRLLGFLYLPNHHSSNSGWLRLHLWPYLLDLHLHMQEEVCPAAYGCYVTAALNGSNATISATVVRVKRILSVLFSN